MKKISFLLPVFILTLIFGSASCQQASNDQDAVVSSINTVEFKKLVDAKEGVLLDVRTPQEYEDGHIAGSINIDFHGENFKEELEKLDKSKTYNVYCRSGKRSANSAEMMEELGFKKVVNLSGGIIGWQENGFPVEK
jgi:rhodanese-related sulfurtransferase